MNDKNIHNSYFVWQFQTDCGIFHVVNGKLSSLCTATLLTNDFVAAVVTDTYIVTRTLVTPRVQSLSPRN